MFTYSYHPVSYIGLSQEGAIVSFSISHVSYCYSLYVMNYTNEGLNLANWVKHEANKRCRELEMHEHH